MNEISLTKTNKKKQCILYSLPCNKKVYNLKVTLIYAVRPSWVQCPNCLGLEKVSLPVIVSDCRLKTALYWSAERLFTVKTV